MCSPCHERIVAVAETEPERSLIGALGDITKEDEEMEHHDGVGMHPDASMMNQPAGELSEGVL